MQMVLVALIGILYLNAGHLDPDCLAGENNADLHLAEIYMWLELIGGIVRWPPPL